MKSTQHKEITITMDEKEARVIKDFLYWLDSANILDEFANPMMDLYTILYNTLDPKDPVPLYDMFLKKK